MIGAMARHRIQVLRAAGWTQRAIATGTGISERTVRTICQEPAIDEADPASLTQQRQIGHPSVVEPFGAPLAALLEAEPRLKTVEVLHRMRQQGYSGGKSVLYERVRALRPREVSPLVRFEGLPGEFSQHDFGAASMILRRLMTLRVCTRRPEGDFGRPPRSVGWEDPSAIFDSFLCIGEPLRPEQERCGPRLSESDGPSASAASASL
jgi:hypothetical protein